MDKYATFNNDGTLEYRLILGVHAIPGNAVPIDEALWLRLTQETDGQWVIDAEGVITKHPLPEIVEDFIQLIARTRFEHETAGITLEGTAIDTTRDSQSLITGAVVQAMLDPGYTLNWKTPTGFVQLTAVQIIGIATAVRAHVQACFDREAMLLDAIQNGSFAPEMLSEGWPA